MGSTSQRRRSAGVVLLAIAFALTVASAPVAAAPPIEPEDFPLGLCTEKIEGAAQIEPLNPNTSDYVVWRCSQYDSQDLYHWKIDDFGTANEKLGELDAMETLKWVRDGVFIGLIGEGFGVLDADGVHSNDNLDFVGSFDLRGPNGSPLNRTIAVRLLVLHSSSAGRATQPAATPAGSRPRRRATRLSTSCSTATGPSAGTATTSCGPPAASSRWPPATG
jgi:hypothetical protein